MEPYKAVKPKSNILGEPSRLLLDTNVVIDIRNYYYGTSMDKAHRHTLEDFLLQNAPKKGWESSAVDIRYGYALLEACWRRGQGLNVDAYARSGHAINVVLSWNRDQVERNFANRHPPCNRDKVLRARTLALESDPDGLDPSIFLTPAYGATLFMAQLDRNRAQWRHRDPMWALEQVDLWMTTELNLRGTYETLLAIDLFCGSRTRKDNARRMLKLSGSDPPDKLASRCWGAAWDISFLRSAEASTFGIGIDSGPGLTYLITRDLDSGFIRLNAEIEALVRSGDSVIGFTSLDVDDLSDADADRVQAWLEHRDSESYSNMGRLLQPGDDVYNHALEAVRRLERKVGITTSSLGVGVTL